MASSRGSVYYDEELKKKIKIFKTTYVIHYEEPDQLFQCVEIRQVSSWTYSIVTVSNSTAMIAISRSEVLKYHFATNFRGYLILQN